VQSLKCYSNEIGVCVFSANVEASQTVKKKKNHLSWIVATNDGEIISGHCTCLAGYANVLLDLEELNLYKNKG
jgi:hypothetical protein